MAPFKSSVARIVYVFAPVLPFTSWPNKVSTAMPAQANFERPCGVLGNCWPNYSIPS